jgi:MerR family transcriptional regulator, mercuric resistance operon regulatory protein
MIGARKLMRIGEMSNRSGVSIDAIRFYERKRVLAAPIRSKGGFRLYSFEDLAALQFIRNLQTLGFSLNEVREFVGLRTNDLRACSAVRKMLDHKLGDIHAKRIALSRLETDLKTALTKCDAQLKRPRAGKTQRCPVLTVFGKSNRKDAE